MEEVFEAFFALALVAFGAYVSINKQVKKQKKNAPAQPPVIAPAQVWNDEDIEAEYEDEYAEPPFHEALYTEHIAEPINSIEGHIATAEGFEPADHDHGDSLLKQAPQPILDERVEQPMRSEWQRAILLTEILGKPVSQKGRVRH